MCRLWFLLHQEVTNFEEQSFYIKSWFRKKKKTDTWTFEMLKLNVGGGTMSVTQTFDWMSKFRSGVTFVDDAERSGQPPKGQSGWKCDAYQGTCPWKQSVQSASSRRLREDVQRIQPEIGFSIMAVLPCTLLCLCRNFWTKTVRLLFRTPLTPQIWHPTTLFQNSSWH